MATKQYTDEHGRTLLMLAVQYQNIKSVEQAVLQCDDIYQTDSNGRTALFYAAERGDEEIFGSCLIHCQVQLIFTLTKLLAVQSELDELYCTYVHHNRCFCLNCCHK